MCKPLLLLLPACLLSAACKYMTKSSKSTFKAKFIGTTKIFIVLGMRE